MSNDSKTPPPLGNSQKAQKYLDWLIKLIEKDKLQVSQSDLSKYNLSTMEDHYRISLKDYEVEVSHSKNPNSGEDMYVMLFNNLGTVADSCERVILSYLHLTPAQFQSFKKSADAQLLKKKQAEDNLKFEQVMSPVDQILSNIDNQSASSQPSQSDVPAAATPAPAITPNLIKPPLPTEEPTSDSLPASPDPAISPDPTYPTQTPAPVAPETPPNPAVI